MANCPAAVPRRRTLLVGAAALACPGVPLFAQPAADTGANMAALVVVIEAGADRVALVDGARLALLHRFPTRPGLLAAPSFWPGGRFVLLASADGWLSKFDLVQRRLVAEVRAGSRLAGVAISSDGRWVMAANTEPPSAPLFDADLNPVKTFAATTRDGRRSSAVDGVHDAPARRSFIVALRDIAELWEISYNPRAEDFYEGLVHDFRMGEGVPTRGFHNARRTFLPAPLTGLYIDPPAIHALGNSAGAEGAASSHAVNLDVRRRVASLVVAGHPQLAGAVAFEAGGRALLAVPNASRAVVSVFDRADWRLLHELPTAGPGLRLAAHPLSPFICVATAGVAADASALTIIDQRSLQAVATVREPGQLLAHAEFSADGRQLLVCTAQDDGALIAYDAGDFAARARLPMRRPVGAWRAP